MVPFPQSPKARSTTMNARGLGMTDEIILQAHASPSVGLRVTIERMDPTDPEVVKMLAEARAKGEHLLASLLKQQAEVEANPANIPPDKLEQGRMAFQKAIDSARRMLKSLDEAQKI